jgi:hypothetical protein
MPSNINIQLAEFQQFVQFAETAIAAGKQKPPSATRKTPSSADSA